MQIIQVVPAISEEASGPSYSVTRLCESLQAVGSQVILAALDFGSTATPPPFLKTFALGLGPRRLGRSPAMYRWLRERDYLGAADVVHNHGMWQMNSVYPAKTMSPKVILVQSPRGAFSPWAMKHGSQLKRVFWPLLQRPALMRADCFHATAQSEYDQIRLLGFKQPIAIVPNGVDVLELPRRQHREDRTLLFLGRVHETKGIDLLLAAWKRVQDQYPSWRLDIVGSDDAYYGTTGYLAKMKDMALRLKLERTRFLEPLYGKEKYQAFRDAELFVLPSRSENFAVTVAESLSMATPAIVSKGAPWSGLNDQKAGWWIDTNVDAFAKVIGEAMSKSRVELDRMGARGREWMRQEFSWNMIAERMYETYRWLADKSRPIPSWVRVD